MPQDAIDELIKLCASILSDGEVTDDEAYRLAEWLNDHRAVAESWPGNQLIRPLQTIWADGSTNKRELHWLARLLISVQREWAQQTTMEVVREKASRKAESLSVDQQIRLPALPAKVRVPSQSEPGVFYDVDLAGPTCSCPDWRGRRSGLPTGHLTRCCKHIFAAFAHVSPIQAEPWLIAFLECGWPAKPKTEWALAKCDSGPALFCTAVDRGWSNVFARDADSYAKFGYNVDEHRWAYGSEPEHGSAIADAILAR